MRNVLITLVLLTGMLFTQACSMKGVNTTLFLKEDTSHLYNLEGQECSESGYQVDKDRSDINEEHFLLITFYSNCDVHKKRTLQQFEVKQWAEPVRKPGEQK